MSQIDNQRTEPNPTTTEAESTTTDAESTATARVEGLRRRMANWASEGVEWTNTGPSGHVPADTQRGRRRAVRRAPRPPFQENLK